jgi:predicted transcriptional regulator
MPEPSAEILRAYLLVPAQFQILADLTENPDGLRFEALQHGISEEQIVELVSRHLIRLEGEHYHVTSIGHGMIKAVSGLS